LRKCFNKNINELETAYENKQYTQRIKIKFSRKLDRIIITFKKTFEIKITRTLKKAYE
jgi:hypothetical protein